MADENKPQQTVATKARIQARCMGECTHARRGWVNAEPETRYADAERTEVEVAAVATP